MKSIEIFTGAGGLALGTHVAGFHHRALEASWQALRQALEHVSQGTSGELAPGLVSAFVQLYTRHIAREESELLPLAARTLDPATLDRVGLAMRRRRGV